MNWKWGLAIVVVLATVAIIIANKRARSPKPPEDPYDWETPDDDSWSDGLWLTIAVAVLITISWWDDWKFAHQRKQGTIGG